MTDHAARGFDPYKILQVDPEADPEVIQAAYRRLAQKWHPDVAPGDEAAARMVAINQAWAQVGDPGRRAAYDAARVLAKRAGVPSPVGGQPAGGQPAGAESRGGSGEASGVGGMPGSGARAQRPPEVVSRDWTSGRSSTGHTYDSASMRTADGTGAAGAPPGNPSGSVLNFGRFAGWSLGEIARRDLEYLEWLDRMPIGRPYRVEIDEILRRTGRRRTAAAEQTGRRGLFRRR